VQIKEMEKSDKKAYKHFTARLHAKSAKKKKLAILKKKIAYE
jgi:hypothetical protein